VSLHRPSALATTTNAEARFAAGEDRLGGSSSATAVSGTGGGRLANVGEQLPGSLQQGA
jgi:hypothetical protein